MYFITKRYFIYIKNYYRKIIAFLYAFNIFYINLFFVIVHTLSNEITPPSVRGISVSALWIKQCDFMT